MTDYSTYVRQALAAGCPMDQILNFGRAGIALQERQLLASAAARLCDRPDGPTAVGYGGARGGGKSYWLLAQMGTDDCQRLPGLKCLLLRKVGKANLEHFEDLRRLLFKDLPHEFSAHRGILTFPNGSRIIAGHFQNETDIDAYLGLEYDIIGIEEATTLTNRKYQDITTCCRTSKLLPDGRHWRPRVYSTTNPGGIGHAWYKARFVTPHLQAQRRGLSTLNSGLSALFVPAGVDDNPFNNPEYRRVLERLSGWQRRAWLHGDWDLAAGQFFTNFRRELHELTDFDETRAREWFAALDYGYTHYTAVLLACTDAEGNTFVLDEHAERLWLPQSHAAAIKAMISRHRLPVETADPSPDALKTRPLELRDLRRFVAGVDVFGRQSDGTTIAMQYAREGIRLRPASMDRINGWAEVLQRFGDPDAGIPPRLFIHRRCARLLDTLPNLQHDPNRPEDVLKADADDDGAGGDDTADALRYLIATKPRRIVERRLIGL